MEKREVIEVPIDEIKTNPFQAREIFADEEIEELAESIRTHGIIQPIILRKLKDDYQLVAGERRLRAARAAALTTIPSILIEIDGIDVAEISLIENIQRKDLNCIEEAKAYNVFITKFGLTQEDVSKKVGKSRSRVANAVRLLTLSDEIKSELLQGRITEGHGKALLGLPNAEMQRDAMHRAIDGSLSVRQTEMLVRNLLMDNPKKRKRRVSMTAMFVDARIYYNEIKKVLKEIKSKGGKADIVERETEDYLEIQIRIQKGIDVQE